MHLLSHDWDLIQGSQNLPHVPAYLAVMLDMGWARGVPAYLRVLLKRWCSMQTLSRKSCCHIWKALLLMSFWPHCRPVRSVLQISFFRLARNCSVFRHDRRSCSVLSHRVISA